MLYSAAQQARVLTSQVGMAAPPRAPCSWQTGPCLPGHVGMGEWVVLSWPQLGLLLSGGRLPSCQPTAPMEEQLPRGALLGRSLRVTGGWL